MKLIFILTKDPSFIPESERYIQYKEDIIPIKEIAIDLYTLYTKKVLWSNEDPIFTTIPIDRQFVEKLYKGKFIIQEIGFIGKWNEDVDNFTDMSALAYIDVNEERNKIPETKFELLMKDDMLLDEMNDTLGAVNEDDIKKVPKPESHIRTELQLLANIANKYNESIISSNISVYFDDRYLAYEEISSFFRNNLSKIIVDGTERARYGEIAFTDTSDMTYDIKLETITIHREKCQFSIIRHSNDINHAELDDLKEEE